MKMMMSWMIKRMIFFMTVMRRKMVMIMMLPKKDKASSTLKKLKRTRDKLNSEYEYDENDVDDVLYLDDDDDDGATLSRGVLQAS